MMRRPGTALGMQCIPCGRTFRDRTDCSRHIEANHIDTKFECPLCGDGKRYRSRHTVTVHIKKKHNVTKGLPEFVDWEI